MIRICCSFVDEFPTVPVGFDLGDLDIIGEYGTVTSRSKIPSQSMMLILSLVSLLDGFQNLLANRDRKEFRFIGVDSSFSIAFRKLEDGQIGVYQEDSLIDTCTREQLRECIEESILELARSNNLERRMNVAEASDFRDSLKRFQAFRC